MKAVQVGILGALLLCAGLLLKIYLGQQAPATPAVAPQTQAAPASTPAPAESQPAAAPAPAPEMNRAAANSEAPRAAHAKRPSPTRSTKPAVETVAESRPPETPATQLPSNTSPSPSAAASQAAQPQQPILNPPSGAETLPPPPREPHHVTIPAGTLITVRLGETLSSDRNQPGDTFSGTLDQPIVIDGFEIAGRGARVQGKVLEAQQAGRVKGVSSLAVQLVKLHTSDGQDVAVSTERFDKEGETSKKQDAAKIGAGAAIGAAIGAIAGGGKGAAIGAGVGGAAGTGTVLGTRGKATVLPVETRLTFKLAEPISLTERIK